MMKVKMLTLTLMLVTLMCTPLLSTCEAQTEQASVKFNGVASGECLLLIESILGPWPPKAFFMGEGTITVSGSALTDEYPPNPNVPYTFYYTIDGVKASGRISARWAGQMINVRLYSKGEAAGLFVEENDVNWFLAGSSGGPSTLSMSYEGTYEDSTGFHKLSGKAMVLAWPIGDLGSQFVAIGAMLLKPDGSPLLSILWSYVDVSLGPGGSLGVLHAANSFRHSVKIKAP